MKIKNRHIHGIAALILAAILALTIFTSTDTVEAGPSVCYFNTYTGYPCPGCGLTRAVSAVGNGDLDIAWDYHPFGLPVYIALILLFLGETVYALFPVQGCMRVLKLIYKISIGIYAVLLLFGVVRFFMMLLG